MEKSLYISELTSGTGVLGKLSSLNDTLCEIRDAFSSSFRDHAESVHSGLQDISAKISGSVKHPLDSMNKTTIEVASELKKLAALFDGWKGDLETQHSEDGTADTFWHLLDLGSSIFSTFHGSGGGKGKSSPTAGNGGGTGRASSSSSSPSLALPSGTSNSTPTLALPPGTSNGNGAAGGDSVLSLVANSDAVIGALNMITEAWDKNAIAKAASAAAQWAINTATTAWEAICSVASVATTVLGSAISFLTSPIGIAIAAIAAIIAIGVLLYENWDTISAKASEVWAFVQNKFSEFDAFLQNVFATDWTEQFGAFGNILNAFFANVKNVWEAIKKVFSGIVAFVKGVFSGDWKKAWEGIKQVFSGIWDGMQAAIKGPINMIIGAINGLISGVVSGVNAVIRTLNKIHFNIPDWLPVFGGKEFGFSISEVSAPQIPYLARGAVLPANRPFLAMLGDQKHGTNIEAPLSTIQEAVTLVMDDHIAAMVAGFEAVVQAIHEQNNSVVIGDEVIARAAERYQRKMAVVRGGLA